MTRGREASDSEHNAGVEMDLVVPGLERELEPGLPGQPGQMAR